MSSDVSRAAAAAASVLCLCLHRMRSGTGLSVGHPCFGSAQSSTHSHCGYTRKMEENRVEV